MGTFIVHVSSVSGNYATLFHCPDDPLKIVEVMRDARLGKPWWSTDAGDTEEVVVNDSDNLLLKFVDQLICASLEESDDAPRVLSAVPVNTFRVHVNARVQGKEDERDDYVIARHHPDPAELGKLVRERGAPGPSFQWPEKLTRHKLSGPLEVLEELNPGVIAEVMVPALELPTWPSHRRPTVLPILRVLSTQVV